MQVRNRPGGCANVTYICSFCYGSRDRAGLGKLARYSTLCDSIGKHKDCVYLHKRHVPQPNVQDAYLWLSRQAIEAICIEAPSVHSSRYSAMAEQSRGQTTKSGFLLEAWCDVVVVVAGLEHQEYLSLLYCTAEKCCPGKEPLQPSLQQIILSVSNTSMSTYRLPDHQRTSPTLIKIYNVPYPYVFPILQLTLLIMQRQSAARLSRQTPKSDFSLDCKCLEINIQG